MRGIDSRLPVREGRGEAPASPAALPWSIPAHLRALIAACALWRDLAVARRWPVALLLALFLLSGDLLFAQNTLDRLVGRRITDIRLVVEGRATTEPDISRVLETETGSPLSMSAVRESVIHLMALSRFQDVRVVADEVSDGVRLTYELVPLKSVKSVQFRGDVALPAGQLRSEVLNRYGSSPVAARADEIARALEAYYHSRGFLNATVRPRVEAAAGARHSTLYFDVSAGVRAAVGAVNVEGVPAATGAGVVQILRLTRGVVFDPVALDDRVAAYVDNLRARGFIEAKVEIEPAYSSDGRRADITVRSTRGPHVTLAFTGDALPASRKDELASIRREGTIDEDVLENEQQSLEAELRAEGFRDAAVRYAREARGGDEVAIVFTIRRGPQYRVARVDITGNEHVSRAALQPMMRLAPGQWFVKSRLDGDIATVAERYRRDGFKDVKVEPFVQADQGSQASLAVVLAVTEGPRTRVESVEFAGNAALTAATLSGEVRARPGAFYYEPAVTADRDSILLGYLNRGYQLATVEVQTKFSPDQSLASLRFAISEGPQIVVDHVLVVGNVRTKAATIEREVALRRGMPLSLEKLADAQARLTALGLFRRVQVTELQRGSETDRDVLVVVDEAAPNTIGYGGGIEVFRRPITNAETGLVDRIFDVVPRGFVEYGRRNLWGKNRSFNLFARAAIRSSNLADGIATSPTSGFREYRLLGTYREPRALGTNVDVGVTGVAEQASRPSFDFERKQVVVEGTHRFGRTVMAGGRYTLGLTRLFNEQYSDADKLLIDRVYGESGVKVSSFSTSITRNTRDDVAEPTRGTLLLLDGTLASERFGSDVGFLRGFAQGFAYRSLPVLRGSVLAVGARLGLVTGFARTIPELDPSGQPVIGPDGQPATRRSVEVPTSERFFAGGENTVRGFDQDQLGTTGVLDVNGVSSGGNALLIFNAELRFPVLQRFGLGGATFVDVGNVFKRVNDMDLGKLRTGLGFGIRWRSPVGPFRIDFGWKATQQTFVNGKPEPRFSPYVSIGQAF
jgi:outer membrane protein insertion porin family